MTEAGILWAWPLGERGERDRAWEQTLARQLEQTPNSVVVWNPSRLRNRLGAFEPVVLQDYEPKRDLAKLKSGGENRD